MLCGATKLTFTVKKLSAVECTAVAEIDRVSSRATSLVINGLQGIVIGFQKGYWKSRWPPSTHTSDRLR